VLVIGGPTTTGRFAASAATIRALTVPPPMTRRG
jgi:hypothetical protein